MDSKIDIPQVFVINRQGVSDETRCSECTESSGLITPQEAAAIRGVSTRVIYRWLEDRPIHFIETDKGELFICLKTFVLLSKGEKQ